MNRKSVWDFLGKILRSALGPAIFSCADEKACARVDGEIYG